MDALTVLPFRTPQPEPTDCAVVYSERAGSTETAIALAWRKGDPANCQLCPVGHCTAGDSQLCLRVIRARIEPEDARLYQCRNMTGPTLLDDPRLPSRGFGIGGRNNE